MMSIQIWQKVEQKVLSEGKGTENFLPQTSYIYEEEMVPTMSEEIFLFNSRNKLRLIDLMMTNFFAAGMICKQAQEDAYTLIVNTAISLAPKHETVVILVEHVD